MHHFNISLHFPINDDYSIIPLFCFAVSLVSLLSYDCNFPVFLIIFFALVCLRLWCSFCIFNYMFSCFLVFSLFFQLFVFLFVCLSLLCVWASCSKASCLSFSALTGQATGRPTKHTFCGLFFTYFSVYHVLIHICMFYISYLYILDDHICMIRMLKNLCMYAIISKLEESGQLHITLLACGSFFQPIWCTLHVDSRHLS